MRQPSMRSTPSRLRRTRKRVADFPPFFPQRGSTGAESVARLLDTPGRIVYHPCWMRRVERSCRQRGQGMRSRNQPSPVLGAVFLLAAIAPELAATEVAPSDLTIRPSEVTLNGPVARQRLIV